MTYTHCIVSKKRNIEPIWVSPVLDTEASNNPLSPRFYSPTWFRLPDGTLIHYSWFIFNTYADVPDILKPTYYFGGYPLPQLLYEQVYAAEKTAKEAPMLAQSKRLNYCEGNINLFLADSQKMQKEIKLMSWLRNNWGWLFIKKDQKIGQLDTTLTDFDAVTMLGFQLVAAISGVQAARLLETSPKGWQSSGSLEDKNYSKLQLSIQTLDYCPILDFHYKLLAKSEYNIEKSYNCIFQPIDTPTEKERAEIKEINSRCDLNYVQAGVISPDEVRGVLRENNNSGYNALAEEMEGEAQDPFGYITEENENIKSEINETENQSSELLNGAQVTSMINLASAVGEGRMSRGTGVNILKTAFGLPPEQAENLIEKTDNDEPGGSSNEQSPFKSEAEVKDGLMKSGCNRTKPPFQIFDLSGGKSLDEWNESEHPRKDNGQFGEGSGSNNNKENNTPKDITELMGEEIKGVKGQEAINTLLEKKTGHVKGAFERKDTGAIDLIWGDENR